MKDPVAAEMEDTDIGSDACSSVEDELLPDRKERDTGPMPLQQRIDLRLRALNKRCSWPLVQTLLAVAAFVALLVYAVLHRTVMQQSMKPSLDVRPSLLGGPAMHHQSLRPRQGAPSTPAPTKQAQAACSYQTAHTCPARSLFHSPDVHRVVTDNLIRTSRRLLTQADYETVNEFAWMGFNKISAELEARAPDVTRELERVHLTEEQVHAVLDVLALLADASVESLGFDIARIVHDSKFATRNFLKFHIEDSLQPIGEIQKLAHLVVPEAMRALWGRGGHDWEMTLDPRSVRAMRMDHIQPKLAEGSIDVKSKSLSIYAGILQEGRVLLDIIKVHLRAQGPTWSTNLRDTIELLFEGISQPSDSNDAAFMEAFLWPLRCGAQGIDALRASLSQEYGHEFKH